jgi:hypothetical protein
MLYVTIVVQKPLSVGIAPTVSGTYAPSAVDKGLRHAIWADLPLNIWVRVKEHVRSAQKRNRTSVQSPVLVRPPHHGGNGGSFGNSPVNVAQTSNHMRKKQYELLE